MADSWSRRGAATNLLDVGIKLKDMQNDLKGWAHRDFGSIIKQTTAIRKRLSVLWSLPSNPMHQKEVNKLSKDLDELLLREELMWRQRSRVSYLREGDRNTKWFQRKPTWRKKKNDISKLKDSSGV